VGAEANQAPAIDDRNRLGVDAIELVRVQLPLRRVLRSGHGEETVREVVLVRALGADGVEGWGECSALEKPTYTGEYTDGAWAVLRDRLAPALLAGRSPHVVGHPFATAALVGARADLVLRRRHEPAAAVDGVGLTWTAVIGIPTNGSAEREGVLAVGAGATALKVKVRPSGTHDWLAGVRASLPGLPIAVDANAGFRAHEDELVSLAAALVVGAPSIDGSTRIYVEQPLPADDLMGHARLASRLAVPIALDESIARVGDIQTAWALGAAALVNVKPAKLGGIGWWAPTAVGTAAIVGEGATDEAFAAVAPAAPDVAGWSSSTVGPERFLGGMVETGVGRAAALALGSRLDLRVTDVGPSSWYFDDDLTDPIELGADGRMHPPAGPGIGVVPRPDRLAQVVVDRLLIRP